jgi:Tfp pilus assembly protein PilV
MNSAHSTRCMHGRSRRVRGITLLEVGIALVVATTAAIGVVELVSVASQQRRISRQRFLAVMEVANQAERVGLLSWDESAPDRLTTWEPSELLAAEVPTATCKIEVTQNDESRPLTRRIGLSVTWTTATGQSPSPARLTIWKHRPAEQP